MANSSSFLDILLRRRTALPAFLITTCCLLAWWVVQRADADMRKHLLQQVELVSQSIDPAHLSPLTGSESDLANPYYQRIKDQLVAACTVHPQYRFVYLMGRSSDGKVIFLADSEPVDSADYSPPGMVFEEVTNEFLRVFDARIPVVEGPTTDRWGTWVSALIPLIDAQSGKVTVLGLDIDARAWALEVAARVALPICLMLVLLIVTGAAFAMTRPANATPRPVLRRLLPPLVVLLLLLIGTAAAFLWRAHQTSLQRQLTAANNTIAAELQLDLKNQAHALATVIRTLTADPRLQEALANGDVDRLRSDWQPLYDSLNKEQNLTHFYFFDPRRICPLRLHQPEMHGDLINRFTLLEAEKTGTTVSGLEVGPLGQVILRVVRPVFREGGLVGFVELGKEIEDALQNRHRLSGSHLAVTLRKELVDKPQWEKSMRSLGREADWSRLEQRVIIYTSLGPQLPGAFVPLAAHSEGDPSELDIVLAGRTWRASALPLTDASGHTIGDLLVLTDITAATAAFEHRLVLGATTVGVLLVGIAAFLIVLLRRTDNDITAQLAVSRKRAQRTARQREAIAQLALDPDIVSGDLVGAVKRIVEVTAATVGVSRVGVWLLSENECELHCLGLHEVEGTLFSQGQTLKIEDAPRYFEAIRRETTIVAEDAQNDPRTCELRDGYLVPQGITALLDAAIVIGGTIKGVVCFEQISVGGRAWQADEESFVGTVASLVAQVLLNAERFQTEKALHESEAQFRALFADSPVSIYIHDRETGQIVDANPAAYTLHGFTSLEELKAKANEFWMEPPYSFDEALAWIRKTAREGTQQFEWLNRKGNGELIWEHVHLSPLTIGGEHRILATIIDITARKQTEELLRRQDALLLAVANAVHTLLSEEHIDVAIQQALKTVGQATDQDRAYIFEYHVDPESGENLMSQRYEWVRDGVSVQIDNPELQNLSFDHLFPGWFDLLRCGEAVYGPVREFPEGERSILEPQDIVSLMVVPVEVGGRFWGFVGFDNCRTDYEWGAEEKATLISLAASLGTAIMRHRAEAALRESNLKLEAATRTKSLFLANMSHEIRTPMNAIIGMSYLVGSTELDRRQRDYVQQIQNAAQSLLRIINDILDFSKIEAGKLELETIAFCLEDVAANALTLQRQPALDKQIELLFDLRSPSLTGKAGIFFGDPLRLEQILSNLLTNAVKFTEAGHVLLALEEVGRTEAAWKLRLIVEDTGIGMTGEQVGPLFTEFTQADNSTTRLHGGTGLGLSIVKRLLALMDGDITVASESGQGSRFTCTLTLTPAPPAAGYRDEPVAQGRRALIVDDYAPARAVLRTLLSHFGVECEEAASGEAALDLLRGAEAAYAYVFTDWVMPGMDGEALIEAIHLLPLPYRPMIVVVSAYDLEGIHACCDLQGLCHFLPKPVLPNDLRFLLAGGRRELTDKVAHRKMINRLQDMRILLVEDNLINQQIASEMLSYHGARVDIAGNGQEALDKVSATADRPYHALLMDIQMPVMDGYEATRRLRAQPRLARLPIIAMTAHAMVDERERCLAAGMNSHIAKPFTMEDLLEALTPYCKRPSSISQTPKLVLTAGDTPLPLLPEIDFDQGLAHCAGNHQLYDRILTEYEQEYAGLADTLEGFLAREQWKELAALIHSFKGLSGTIGARDLQVLAEKIERAGATQSPELASLIHRLRPMLASTLEALRQLRRAPVMTAASHPAAEADQSPHEILEELCRLLAESDSAAQDLWKNHEQTLRTVLPPLLGKQIAQAITLFQFEEAMSLLRLHRREPDL